MRLIAISAIWFVLIFIAQVMAFSVFASYNSDLLIDAAVSTLLLFAGMDLIYFLQKYSGNYFNKLVTRLTFTAVVIIGVILLEYYTTHYIYGELAGSRIYDLTFYTRLVIVFSQIVFFSVVFWLLDYIRRRIEKEKQEQDSEKMLRNAELIRLRQQLQPHFLFNSLNSINSLVVTEPQQARKMILNLSDFLRGTLKEDDNKVVPLDEEIALLELYLEIEKVRFGHRLNVILNIQEEAKKKLIPPLLLQPVVENAIKFGLYNTLEKVEIVISAEQAGNQLRVSVRNPYDEESTKTKKGSGFGLSIIQKRLQLLFHRTDLLQVQKDGKLYTTTILIPQV